MMDDAPKKRPRHYALEILELKTKDERQQALANLPPDMIEYRGLIEDHIKALWPKVKNGSQTR